MATYSKHSCLRNLMDRGAWLATVHGVAKSLTGLSKKSSEVQRSSVLAETRVPSPLWRGEVSSYLSCFLGRC